MSFKVLSSDAGVNVSSRKDLLFSLLYRFGQIQLIHRYRASLPR